MAKQTQTPLQHVGIPESRLCDIPGFPKGHWGSNGTQIPIKAPSVTEGEYVNRKSIHTINIGTIIGQFNGYLLRGQRYPSLPYMMTSYPMTRDHRHNSTWLTPEHSDYVVSGSAQKGHVTSQLLVVFFTTLPQ
ncbi:hypothetical protein HF521_019587 [Silurus meridionalis]|uniref:Uncharacterized protein n=1 Tax=Silurus meridionalis TaxID=175797 RepID=A0A8T0BJN0_SILME|nr:hypothetical protein HF521_019587 [Silurus meridionalis]